MIEVIVFTKAAVVAGKHKEIGPLVQTAVDEKVDLGSIIDTALIGGNGWSWPAICERGNICSGDADCRPHHAERLGHTQAVAEGGGFAVKGDRADRHGKRRSARHREKPGGHDA